MLAVGEEPSWSSNGQRLAFIEKGRLLTIEELGGAPTQLSRPKEFLQRPTWSPDGRWIAVERQTIFDKITNLYTGQVVVVGAGGHSEHTLTREPRGTEFDGGPTWAGNSNELVLAADLP